MIVRGMTYLWLVLVILLAMVILLSAAYLYFWYEDRIPPQHIVILAMMSKMEKHINDAFRNGELISGWNKGDGGKIRRWVFAKFDETSKSQYGPLIDNVRIVVLNADAGYIIACPNGYDSLNVVLSSISSMEKENDIEKTIKHAVPEGFAFKRFGEDVGYLMHFNYTNGRPLIMWCKQN